MEQSDLTTITHKNTHTRARLHGHANSSRATPTYDPPIPPYTHINPRGGRNHGWHGASPAPGPAREPVRGRVRVPGRPWAPASGNMAAQL